MTQPDDVLVLEPVQIDPALWPAPREYPGDDFPDVGHGPDGESAVGEPPGHEGAEAQWVAIPCPDHSSRGTRRIVAGILHTAEGALTVTELGNYFRTTPRYVSSHVGVDAAGRHGRYVPDSRAAWTNPDVNESTLTLEQCAFAKWNEQKWLSEQKLLEATARWMAEVHVRYGVPLRWITPAQLNAAVKANDVRLGGFSDHYCVTIARNRVGGHTDCGPGFRGRPKDVILARARALAYPKENSVPTENELKSAVNYWRGHAQRQAAQDERDTEQDQTIADLKARVEALENGAQS